MYPHIHPLLVEQPWREISVSVVVEERHGNTTTPRVCIDTPYLKARSTVGLAGRLTVRQLEKLPRKRTKKEASRSGMRLA